MLDKHRFTPLDCSNEQNSQAVQATNAESGIPEHVQARSAATAVPVATVERYLQHYMWDCQGQSPVTLAGKGDALNKLLWYLRQRGHTACGESELVAWLFYIRNGHLQPGGRWGNPQLTRPVGERTVQYYYTYAKAYFSYLERERIIAASPLRFIKRPTAPDPVIRPFTDDEIDALRAAAVRSPRPRRDLAIIELLLDSGVRASELVALRRHNIEFQGHTGGACHVEHGKGNKSRYTFFGASTAKALWRHMNDIDKAANTPLFMSDSGASHGRPLTSNGLLQLIERLGEAAGIEQARCSPHTFRHTFAVRSLIGGVPARRIQLELGHSDPRMMGRYQDAATILAEPRSFNPADTPQRKRGR